MAARAPARRRPGRDPVVDIGVPLGLFTLSTMVLGALVPVLSGSPRALLLLGRDRRAGGGSVALEIGRP